MNVNSRSEALWVLLHQAGALLNQDGFADPAPPLPASSPSAPGNGHPVSAEAYDDLVARFGEHLAFGSTWPVGTGAAQPLALVLCEAGLTEAALAFVRTWFENPKVNLNVADNFFIQPLPTLSGEKPPYQPLIKDLCGLLQPKVLLSLGPVPAQRLLGAPLSLETLRGSDYRFERWSMVTTLDPEAFSSLDETERGPFKSQVWKDLQRLLGKLRYG